jgi:hypothetical protein
MFFFSPWSKRPFKEIFLGAVVSRMEKLARSSDRKRKKERRYGNV